MFKINKNLLPIAALLIGSIGLVGCGDSANTNTTKTTNTTTTTTTTNTNTATTNTNTATTNTDSKETASADKIGVPECDDYIAKYDACVTSKVPEAQRAALKSSLDTMKKSWKDASATAQGKAALASGCKQAHDAAKQSMAAFSCAW